MDWFDYNIRWEEREHGQMCVTANLPDHLTSGVNRDGFRATIYDSKKQRWYQTTRIYTEIVFSLFY